MHVCKEQKYFQDHIHEYETKKSHKGKSLRKHCEEVLEIFNKLYEFYSFDNETLLEIGHYLAFYHDLGKLDKEWNIQKKSNPYHSIKSFEHLLRARVNFYTKPELTPLLLYLIRKHHGTLTLPEKMLARNSSEKKIIEILENKNYLSKFQNLSLIDIGDIFGLFKIADALSASQAESSKLKIETLAVRKPKYNEQKVRSMIKKEDFLEERWKNQLKIKDLPEVGLLRAPTGWGKTTVSLLFALDKSCNRIFYLLPTITAINKFYRKMQKSFKENVSKYFYFYDTEIKEDDEKISTVFFVKNFLTPMVITTVDQFLLSFLQCGKYHTKRVSYKNSAVILDEVHLLNPLMLNLLSYFFLEYKHDYKMKLLLMSATLPKAYYEYFSREFNLSKNAFLDYGEEYKKKRRVVFDLCEDDITTNIKSIYDNYKKGRKVLVAVNTVEKAVEIGKKLREYCKMEKENVVIFHARFMYLDRKNKEKFLEEMVNKNRPHILIATQVCEVSLDISYDILYTEAAPLASIIQRFGRVNRYGTYAKEVNSHVYFPTELQKRETYHYPYEKWEIEDCWNVLKKLDGRLKNEKQLIDEFDKLVSFEKLKEEIEKTSEKIDLDFWKTRLQMFYSLDVAEEKLKDVLGYRDTFTTLVIPSPEMISDKENKLRLDKLRKMMQKKRDLSFVEQNRLFAIAKEASVPIPIWWLKGKRIDSRVFPIVYFDDKEYTSTYGMIKKEASPVII